MAKIDDMLHSVGLHALAKTEQQKTALESEEGVSLLPEHGEVYTRRRPGFTITGPRGRDPGGYPKVIPAGMPPGQFGEPERPFLPKGLELPPRPGNFASFLNVVVAANSGEVLNQYVSFPIGTIFIDNFTTVWLYVYGPDKFIPPLTMGWQLPVFKRTTQLRVTASSPPTIAQPANTTGNVLYIYAHEQQLPLTSGVSA